eukprot:Polyplicarium_translucidae@DN4259_c0_g1_i1.p3
MKLGTPAPLGRFASALNCGTAITTSTSPEGLPLFVTTTRPLPLGGEATTFWAVTVRLAVEGDVDACGGGWLRAAGGSGALAFADGGWCAARDAFVVRCTGGDGAAPGRAHPDAGPDPGERTSAVGARKGLSWTSGCLPLWVFAGAADASALLDTIRRGGSTDADFTAARCTSGFVSVREDLVTVLAVGLLSRCTWGVVARLPLIASRVQ